MAKSSSRQILVGRLPARMQGLDEIFDGLYELGRRPDEAGLGMALSWLPPPIARSRS